MADRRPLVTPGRIDELDPADALEVERIISPGVLTFEDSSGGPHTLASLVGGGGGGGTILGTTPASANRLLRSTATLDTIEASPAGTIDNSGNLAGIGTIGSGAITSTGASSFGSISSGSIAVTGGITATTTIAATGAVSGSNLSGTNTGDQTITLTGDVTGSGTGSFAATIANDAVTYAKMQNVSAASLLLGRGAGGGAGDVQEIVLGANLSMTGTTLNAATGGGGEANTASNVGSGADIFKQKTGVDLELRGVAGINDISAAVNGDNVEVNGALLLPLNGSRAMTAALNMGGFGLVSLGYNTISPTAIASQQNDYSPTSWSGADVVRLTFTGSQTITGFDASVTAVRKVVVNTDATDTLTIAHESASSTAANRVLCPNNVNLIIPPRGSVTILYDSTATRWRAVEVNNGAIVLPGSVLHSVRRSAQLTNITGTVFPGYDTTLATLNSTYWSYSSGSWTCSKAHRAAIFTRMSYQVNSGAVSARAACDIVQGSGGVYSNNLQTHRDSAYSTTNTEGHLTNFAIRDWAVNEQFRVYYYTNAGAMDILAAMNDCTILWVADL